MVLYLLQYRTQAEYFFFLNLTTQSHMGRWHCTGYTCIIQYCYSQNTSPNRNTLPLGKVLSSLSVHPLISLQPLNFTPTPCSPSLHSRATLDSKLFICTSRFLIAFDFLRREWRFQQRIMTTMMKMRRTPPPTPIQTSIGITLLSSSLKYSRLPKGKLRLPTTT